jgi:predicted small secreted protein
MGKPGKLIVMAFVVLLGCALLGCETVKGLGRDVENLGQEIQK